MDRLPERVLGIEEFVAVVETGSFVRAAERLGLTSSGIGKSIARLEARMGVRLLSRTTRKVSLTDDGAAFYHRCKQLLSDLDDAEQALAQSASELRGLLRMDAPTAYGKIVVVPIVAAFLEMHHGVTVDLRLSDRLSNPVEDRLDLVFRIGELRDSGMVASRVGQVHFCAYASPAYLSRMGTPNHPHDLDAYARLTFTPGSSGRPFPFVFVRGAERVQLTPAYRLVSSDAEAVLAAAVSGLGVAYLPDFLAMPEVMKGSISLVLPEWSLPGPPVHVLYPQPKHLSKRVRAFADFFVRNVRKKPSTA